MGSKAKVRTIGRAYREDHDASPGGCDCKAQPCSYRKGRVKAWEERCPDCGYVSSMFSGAQVGHDNLCSEPEWS